MEIDKITKNNVIKTLEKIIDNKLAVDIEYSIYTYSIEYSEINETPYLLLSIYESTCDNIINLLKNKETPYLLNAIKQGKIDAKKIAFMKPEELNPEKYESIIKKREIEEHKKNSKTGTDAYKCSKCKKSNSTVSVKQTRSGDEAPTTFITCLECGHSYKL